MRKEKNVPALINYYKKLWFSNAQSIVLWNFSYSERCTKHMIEEYKNSWLKAKWTSFCKSLSEFMELINYKNYNFELPIYWAYALWLYLIKDWKEISREKLINEIRKYDSHWFDKNWYNWEWYNWKWFFDNHIHKNTWTEYDLNWYDWEWYDRDWYNEDWYDREWYDRDWYDRKLFDRKWKYKYSMRDCLCSESDILCCESDWYNEIKYKYRKQKWSTSPDFWFCKMMDPGILRETVHEVLEKTRTDKYEHIEETNFLSTLINPTSSFRTNCNTASISNIKAQLEGWYSLRPSMLRFEELLNYYNFSLRKPEQDRKFWVTIKVADKPDSANKMLLVWIKWAETLPTRQNIVALLDVSWSMSRRQEETQLTIMTLISKLNDWDKFSLITYSDNDKTVINDITFDKTKIDDIIEEVLTIEIEWCTYGSNWLNQAYKLISKNKIEDWINRVVIITDWDFNFWDCDTDSIEKLILKKKESWAYLSVVWVWTYNNNDELMETLARNWNWNYCVVNSLEDVEENIYEKYNKLMFTIATDVKAQIEFNPKYVKSYRLIGYENRSISHEDFNDDDVIAEPYWSWNYAMAYYELEMNDNWKTNAWLKYQKSEIIDSDELCTVHIRYKELWDIKSKEESTSFKYEDIVVENDYDTDLAYVLFVAGEHIRRSEYIDKLDLNNAKTLIEDLINNSKYDSNKWKLEIINKLLKH